jgi:hypothetical protein
MYQRGTVNTKENAMNIVNLTPHPLSIVAADGAIVSFPKPAEGINIPRCKETSVLADVVNGINMYRTQYGAVENLPEPEEDTLYVVSFMIRDRLPERTDFVSPGKLLRSPDGVVIGAEGFSI